MTVSKQFVDLAMKAANQRTHQLIEIEDLKGTIEVEREAHRITRWKLDHWYKKARALEKAAQDYLAFYEWHMAAACAPDLSDLLDNLPDRREEINTKFQTALAIEAGEYPARPDDQKNPSR